VASAGLGFLRRPAPGTLAALLATGLLAGAARLLHPRHLFVTLDYPPHMSAERAHLARQAPVLGYADEAGACAWPLELIVPHHLVNDQVGEKHVLAAY